MVGCQGQDFLIPLFYFSRHPVRRPFSPSIFLTSLTVGRWKEPVSLSISAFLPILKKIRIESRRKFTQQLSTDIENEVNSKIDSFHLLLRCSRCVRHSKKLPKKFLDSEYFRVWSKSFFSPPRRETSFRKIVKRPVRTTQVPRRMSHCSLRKGR